ncbi:negative regulation of SNARE complex assembly [Balamuthia mandrillaris]
MWEELPPELQVECLKWLGGAPGRDWLHCCLTSKSMFKLGNDPTLWHYYCQQQQWQGFGSGDTEEAVSDWKAQYLQSCNRLELFADTSPGLLVLSPDKLTVRKGENGAGHTRCRNARKWDSGKHYFEVTIKHTSSQIFIGIILTDRDTHNSIVGHSYDSGWCVIPYTGVLLGNHGKQQAEPQSHANFNVGDVIGVYLDIDAGDLLYFWNSSYLVGLRNAEEIREHKPYYAAVSLMFQDEEVTFRFPPSIPSFVKDHLAATKLAQ